MKWNDLTMKERSDLMSLFLKAGVGSLSDMRHIYDETIDRDVWSYNNGGFVENPLKYKYPNGGELKPATITEKLG